MPLRIAAILFGLFAACIAICLVAWATGSELYLFLPPVARYYGKPVSIEAPPTHPGVIVFLLVACGALYLYSPHYSLVFFTILLVGMVLGNLVGYFAFTWTPTLAQWLLTVAMTGETMYGWAKHGYYLDY